MLLPLHDAAAAEHVGDPEGDLVGAVRALMGSGALVVTDGAPQRAAQLATELAKEYWRRAELEPEVRTSEQAVAAGLQVDGTVLLVETADCGGAAAAGDSVASLKALLGAVLPGPALVPAVDPTAAKFHRRQEPDELPPRLLAPRRRHLHPGHPWPYPGHGTRRPLPQPAAPLVPRRPRHPQPAPYPPHVAPAVDSSAPIPPSRAISPSSRSISRPPLSTNHLACSDVQGIHVLSLV